MSLFLSAGGLEVDRASGRDEAFDKIRSGTPDVIVADLDHAGADGAAFCRELEQHPETKRIAVIAIAGYPTPESATAPAPARFDRVLLKPCLPSDLLTAIRRTIRASRALRAEARGLRKAAVKLRGETRDARHALSGSRLGSERLVPLDAPGVTGTPRQTLPRADKD